MNDYITIGEIIKAQGIKGEIKVRPLTDDPMRFTKLKIVYVAGIPYKTESMRIDRFVYIKLAGIDDRNSAERLVGKTIDIDRILAAPLDDEYTFYVADVEGSDLFADDKKLGVITSVDGYGAADVFTVRGEDGRIFRFPYLKKLFVRFDAENGRFIVKADELEKVSVYED